jgi:hypothetical protein
MTLFGYTHATYTHLLVQQYEGERKASHIHHVDKHKKEPIYPLAIPTFDYNLYPQGQVSLVCPVSHVW